MSETERIIERLDNDETSAEAVDAAIALLRRLDAENRALREALKAAQDELMVLGADLREIDRGERRRPAALLNPEVMQQIDTILRAAKGAEG